MPVTRELAVTCAQRNDVLLRIVGLCHRRRCTILALHHVCEDAATAGRVRLTVEVSDHPARSPATRLSNLVDVQAVETLPTDDDASR